MTLYFCIDDVLDRVEKAGGSLQTLIEVGDAAPGGTPHPEDVFVLSSSPKIFDISSGEAAHELARIADDIPLYRINVMLSLDAALTERHANATIMKAMTAAFSGESLPHTLPAEDSGGNPGVLRHPMLDHLDTPKLCGIYTRFLKALGPGRLDYNFENDILGKHENRFLEFFDGFVQGGRGKVKAHILIGFSQRQDHQASGKQREDPARHGQMRARKMHIGEPHELLWAWFEADQYQMRRCRDIHRIRLLEGLPRLPNWIRADIFALIERESMKQVFAEGLMSRDPRLEMVKNLPALAQALRDSAQGQADERLKRLMAGVQNQDAAYGGEAADFAAAAAGRYDEARRARLV